MSIIQLISSARDVRIAPATWDQAKKNYGGKLFLLGKRWMQVAKLIRLNFPSQILGIFDVPPYSLLLYDRASAERMRRGIQLKET